MVGEAFRIILRSLMGAAHGKDNMEFIVSRQHGLLHRPHSISLNSRRLSVVQVEECDVKAGEERQLRAGLRQIESQQSAAEQCQQASNILGGSDGVSQGVQNVEHALRAILSQESMHAAAQAHPPDSGMAPWEMAVFFPSLC